MAWPSPEDAPEPESHGDDPHGSSHGPATSDSRELAAFFDSFTTPSTVHVVEGDPLYRRIFSRTLSAAGYSVRAYATPEEFLAAVGSGEAGCLLFTVEDHAPPRRRRHDDNEDESAGPLDGPASLFADRAEHHVSSSDLLARLSASRSPLAAVAVTSDLPFEPALALLRRGAIDVLEKPVKRDQLVTAVREALAVSAARRDRRAASARLACLSERQFGLLRLLSSRWPRWTLALRLRVSPRELARRSAEIARILGAASPADAVDLFREATSEARLDPPPQTGRRTG